MPAYDDELDEPPLVPQPPRPPKPHLPQPPAQGPPARRVGRQNPLIPVMSLRKWCPDPDLISDALAPARPPGVEAQGGANEPGAPRRHR